MAHHVYTTQGFIVHSLPQGEAGKYLLIFTRDLGMIGATAQGVRLSKSKMRYFVKDFSYSLFSVVRGREVWRMVGVKDAEGSDVVMLAENMRLYVRILSLLKRLLHGEEKNEKLFEVLNYFHGYLLKNNLEKENRDLVEYVTVLRTLDSLGYISNNNLFKNILSTHIINEVILKEVQDHKDEVIKEINSGLKESQL
jgi:recombinational DNA repair protein (RecF pathway)